MQTNSREKSLYVTWSWVTETRSNSTFPWFIGKKATKSAWKEIKTRFTASFLVRPTHGEKKAKKDFFQNCFGCVYMGSFSWKGYKMMKNALLNCWQPSLTRFLNIVSYEHLTVQKAKNKTIQKMFGCVYMGDLHDNIIKWQKSPPKPLTTNSD